MLHQRKDSSGYKLQLARSGAPGEMEKNLAALQKNMGMIKQAKDQLSSLPSAGGDAIKKEGDSIK